MHGIYLYTYINIMTQYTFKATKYMVKEKLSTAQSGMLYRFLYDELFIYIQIIYYKCINGRVHIT